MSDETTKTTKTTKIKRTIPPHLQERRSALLKEAARLEAVVGAGASGESLRLAAGILSEICEIPAMLACPRYEDLFAFCDASLLGDADAVLVQHTGKDALQIIENAHEIVDRLMIRYPLAPAAQREEEVEPKDLVSDDPLTPEEMRMISEVLFAVAVEGGKGENPPETTAWVRRLYHRVQAVLKATEA